MVNFVWEFKDIAELNGWDQDDLWVLAEKHGVTGDDPIAGMINANVPVSILVNELTLTPEGDEGEYYFGDLHYARLLFAANRWSSDEHLALLSLATTREVHNEDHRKQLLAEIDGCNPKSGWDEDVLSELKLFVSRVNTGAEWISDRKYMRLSEFRSVVGEEVFRQIERGL